MSTTRQVISALVLSSVDSGAHIIVRLLTEDSQLIPVFAPQARRGGKRARGIHLQPLSLIEARLSVRADRDLARLSGAQTVAAFTTLKGDLLRFALATTMAEVVLHLVAEHGAEPGIFSLLEAAWRHLDDPAHPADEALLLLFELRMLAHAGSLPDPETLTGLSDAATATLTDWLGGRWRRLPARDVRPVARALEHLIRDHSGRPLKSRPFLDSQLPANPA